MPVNGYTTGRDVTVTIVGPGGTNVILDPTQVTQFDAKPLKKEDWSRPLNLPPIPLYMPDGWRGTIQADRKDSSLDDMQDAQELSFWAGQNMRSGTIMETITESDGSLTQRRFDNCQFWVEEPGAYHGEGKITQRVEFCASTRKVVA